MKIFKVEVLSPLRILTSPLFEETLELFFFFLFFPFSLFPFFQYFFSLLFFYAPSPKNLGVFMIFEEINHFFKNFIFKSLHMEWHGHDCGYTGGECIFQSGVCTIIFLDEASK
jgi:hypothetical protein